MAVRVCFLACLIVFALPWRAHAHALLQTASPAANTTVHAGIVPIVLTYNSRVDAGHSALTLLHDSTSTTLTIDPKAAANILRSQTPPLQAGRYLLHWQAVASDGHISRGQVAFEVK